MLAALISVALAGVTVSAVPINSVIQPTWGIPADCALLNGPVNYTASDTFTCGDSDVWTFKVLVDPETTCQLQLPPTTDGANELTITDFGSGNCSLTGSAPFSALESGDSVNTFIYNPPIPPIANTGATYALTINGQPQASGDNYTATSDTNSISFAASVPNICEIKPCMDIWALQVRLQSQ